MALRSIAPISGMLDIYLHEFQVNVSHVRVTNSDICTPMLSAIITNVFEGWTRNNLKEGFSLQEAAKTLATSTRTLQRRCDAVLGKSPLAYFQDLRVEHAQSLLHGNDVDIETIAAEVGYADGATLRTLLRQRLGRGVRDLRTDLR